MEVTVSELLKLMARLYEEKGVCPKCKSANVVLSLNRQCQYYTDTCNTARCEGCGWSGMLRELEQPTFPFTSKPGLPE